MNLFATLALALAGGWLGWQLLRQNGRMLLRLEEIEKRLDELEFRQADDALSRESGARHSASVETESETSGEWETHAPDPDNRALRFANRSLARSRIQRDGLKAGTLAPDFRLPTLDGRGELSLSQLRGRRVLVIFSDPHCGPCNTLAPGLEKFHRGIGAKQRSLSPLPSSTSDIASSFLRALLPQTRDGLGPADKRAAGVSPADPGLLPTECRQHASVHGEREGGSPPIAVVMISRGEPKENRAKVKEHGLTFPVVLQQQWEISRRYAMFATPISYLIDASGIIMHDVAVGVDAIVALMQYAVDPRMLANGRGSSVSHGARQGGFNDA